MAREPSRWKETVYSLKAHGDLLVATSRGEVELNGGRHGVNLIEEWGPRERVAWLLAHRPLLEAVDFLREAGHVFADEWALIRNAWRNTFGAAP